MDDATKAPLHTANVPQQAHEQLQHVQTAAAATRADEGQAQQSSELEEIHVSSSDSYDDLDSIEASMPFKNPFPYAAAEDGNAEDEMEFFDEAERMHIHAMIQQVLKLTNSP